MFNGNFYGLVITLLTLAIAVVLTLREVQETGIRFEVTIQPVKEYVAGEDPKRRGKQDEKPQIALKPRQSVE